MAINLDKMTLEELNDLRRDVDMAIKGFEKKRKAEALKAVQMAAQEYGYTLDEVLGGKAPKNATKGMAKYANPADKSQTWTGRGRQPQWIKDALAKGKPLESMAI